MESLSLQPSEIVEKSGVQEQVEARSLNEATFAPEGYVERQGDYHQAEAIQSYLAIVLEDQPLTQSSNEGFQDQLRSISLNETPQPASINEPTTRLAGSLEQATPSSSSPLGMKYDGINEAVLPASVDGGNIKDSGSQEQVLPFGLDGARIKELGTSEQVMAPSNSELGWKLDGSNEEVLPASVDGGNIKDIGLQEQELQPAEAGAGWIKQDGITEQVLPKDPDPNPAMVGMTRLVDQVEKFFGGSAQELGFKVSDLSEEIQLKLQGLMEKKSEFETTLSNIVKGFESTQEDLIGNLK